MTWLVDNWGDAMREVAMMWHATSLMRSTS